MVNEEKLEHEDIEKGFGVKRTDFLKTAYKEVEIKLAKRGIEYRETANIFLPEYEGYVVFVLPGNKDFRSIELYDLKTPERLRLIRYSNIPKSKSLKNYYLVRKIKNNWVILVKPEYTRGEVEVEIRALLYPEQVPDNLKFQADYYMHFDELILCLKEYVTDDFRANFGMFADDSIIVNVNGVKSGAEELGLTERLFYNGLICEGKPSITKALAFTNIQMWGKDRDKENLKNQLRKEIESDRKEWKRAILIGVILAIILIVFQNFLSSIGDWIIHQMFG